jgi:hypothetical protein
MIYAMAERFKSKNAANNTYKNWFKNGVGALGIDIFDDLK